MHTILRFGAEANLGQIILRTKLLSSLPCIVFAVGRGDGDGGGKQKGRRAERYAQDTNGFSRETISWSADLELPS